MRQLTEDHKQKLAQGRKRRAEANATIRLERSESFNRWSKSHAKAWEAWKLNCGRAQHDCQFCQEYRQITSAIPHM